MTTSSLNFRSHYTTEFKLSVQVRYNCLLLKMRIIYLVYIIYKNMIYGW